MQPWRLSPASRCILRVRGCPWGSFAHGGFSWRLHESAIASVRPMSAKVCAGGLTVAGSVIHGSRCDLSLAGRGGSPSTGPRPCPRVRRVPAHGSDYPPPAPPSWPTGQPAPPSWPTGQPNAAPAHGCQWSAEVPPSVVLVCSEVVLHPVPPWERAGRNQLGISQKAAQNQVKFRFGGHVNVGSLFSW